MPKQLKAIDELSNKDELVVKGYLALWGGEDLSGEKFTPETDFESDYTRNDTVLIDWEHGRKPDGEKISPGEDNPLGHVNWKSAVKDKYGILLERVLNRRNEYVQKVIEPLIRMGRLASSSQAVPALVEKADDGTIIRWGIRRDTLTVMPMEPRLMTEHQQSVIKSITDEYPQLADVIIAKGAQGSAATGNGDVGTNNQTETKNNGGNIMTDNKNVNIITRDEFTRFHDEVMDEVKAAIPIKKLDRVLEVLENSSLPKKAGYIAPDSEGDKKNAKSFGDFLLAAKYKNISRLTEVYGVKAMGEDVGADGGFLIPPEYQTQILQFTPESNPVMAKVRRIPVGSDAGGFPSLDQFVAPTAGAGDTAFAGQVTAATTAENTTLTETAAKFKDLNYLVHKIGGFVKVSNELIADSPQSIEALLTSLIRLTVDAKLTRDIIRGSGVGEPLGILNADCAVGITPATNNQFSLADGMNMISRHKVLDASRTVWLLSRSLLPDFAAYWTVTAGENFVQPSQPVGRALLGYDTIYCEHMPLADASGDAILVDLSSYLLFEREGLSVAYSPHANFITDQGTWRFSGRWDGKPWLSNVITEANPGTGRTISTIVYHND